MKYSIVAGAVLYIVIAIGVFAVQTQLPVTLGLALARSVLWPVWIAGGLHGTPTPMDSCLSGCRTQTLSATRGRS